jgi:hypothetical protein
MLVFLNCRLEIVRLHRVHQLHGGINTVTIFIILVIFRVIFGVVRLPSNCWLACFFVLLVSSLHKVGVKYTMRAEHISSDSESDVHSNNVIFSKFHFLCHFEGIRVGLLCDGELLPESMRVSKTTFHRKD